MSICSLYRENESETAILTLIVVTVRVTANVNVTVNGGPAETAREPLHFQQARHRYLTNFATLMIVRSLSESGSSAIVVVNLSPGWLFAGQYPRLSRARLTNSYLWVEGCHRPAGAFL